MPPPATIDDFDPRFYRPCIFPRLRRLGYRTRVTINNGVPNGAPFSTELVVSLSAFDQSGQHIGETTELMRLEPGEIEKLDIDAILGDAGLSRDDDDQLCILHLVPTNLVGSELVDVDSRELMAHVRASDDFIEFQKREGGIVTGVAYQTGPLNDARLSSTRTTVCQAPKVIVSEPVDTLLCLMNVSTRLDYASTVRMDFWILGT